MRTAHSTSQAQPDGEHQPGEHGRHDDGQDGHDRARPGAVTSDHAQHPEAEDADQAARTVQDDVVDVRRPSAKTP